jgi:hypothetical protein
MLNIRRQNRWIAGLLVVCAALAGCAPKTNVSVTGNVPAQYSHVFVTVQEVWFNTSATALPSDTTWTEFPLTTPVTIDLATSIAGTLTSITTGLSLPTGTYAQVRLFPVDPGTTLLSSASALGAIYNSEVQYIASDGSEVTLPLELENPEQGIGIQTSLTIAASSSTGFAGLGSSTAATSTTAATSATTTGTDSTIDTNPFSGTVASTTSTPTGTSSADVSTTQSTVTPVTAAINVDGARDLVPFLYSAQVGVLLNPHLSVYDTTTTGAITGTLTVSGLSSVSTSASSTNLNIQVTAESLSADGSRHEQVNSTAVNSDGSFTLYPLSTSTSSPTSYDLVIHGPGIATVIVKGVAVTAGAPGTTTPVSIGTITPRAATSSFSVNLATTTTPLPAGAIVGFYQTIPVSGEVPYLIEQAPLDPFNRNFASAVAVSADTLDYGTYSSGAVTVTSAAPSEGTATYKIAATAPQFADGALTPTVKGPSTAVVLASPAALTVESGATATSIPFQITNSGNFNAGQLIVSHDGAIVATADLTSLLTGGGSGTVTVTGLPGGTSSSTYASGYYFVAVRAWNTSNPLSTLFREVYPTPLDLRSGATTGYSLSID